MDGHGTTISFGTSSFDAAVISVKGPSLKRESIDETTMATADAMAFDPADLYDGGEFSLTVVHDIADLPPIDGANETITIDWAGTGNEWSFSGHMTGYEGGASIGERMEADVTIKVSGAVSVTPAGS